MILNFNDKGFKMKLSVSRKFYQSGRSMIEMLGVLAIVGVLSAGGIAGYSMAMQAYKGMQLVERINLIATRTRQLYKGNYASGTLNTNLINSGKLSSNDLQNPFGGTLTVASSDASYFAVIVNNVTAETCVDLFGTDWGNTGTFYSIEIDDTTELKRKDYSYPVPASTVITYCKGGNKKVDVVFK